LDRKAALRPAIIVGAVFEMAALFWMGRSDGVQGNWRMGLQLLVIFLVPAALTWLFLVTRKAPQPRA
jgi:hypothetical protein